MGKDVVITREIMPSGTPELSAKTFSAIDVLQELPTQATSNHPPNFQEHPYEGANITTIEIDPLNPPYPLKFSSTYVLGSSLASLEEIDTLVSEATGKPLTDLKDLLVIEDGVGDEVARIGPIILEKYYDESGRAYLVAADGNNRLFRCLTLYPERKFQAIVIDGVDTKFQPTYKPVDLNKVELLSEAPPLNKRRRLLPNTNPATYQDNRPDFRVFGSSGPRSTTEERIANISLKPLIKKDLTIKEELINKIRQGFVGYAPPPVESITSPRIEDGVPEVVDFNGVSRICSSLGSADFSVRYFPENNGSFKALIKTKEEFEATATVGTAILTPEQARTFSPFNQEIPGEFSLNPNTLQEINKHSRELDLGLPRIAIASSRNPLAPEVIGHRIWDENKRYYSVITLELSNGKEVPIVLNHPKLNENNQNSFGSVILIRNANSNIILVHRHREMIGLSQIEAPRMFGFDRKRLELEIGEKIVSASRLTKEIRLNSCGSIDNSPTNFRLYDIEAPNYIQTEYFDGIYEQTKETSRPGRLSPREAHDCIINGTLGDSLTICIITLSQLAHHELYFNKKFSGHFILFEKVFDPLLGEIAIMPRLPLALGDRFSTQHTDLGKSLDVTFGRQLDFKTISSLRGHNFIPIPLENLAEMALEGKIDPLSLSHLSVLLRRSGVWCYQRQIDPRISASM